MDYGLIETDELKPEIVKDIAFDIEKEPLTDKKKDLYHFESQGYPIAGHITAKNKKKALEKFEDKMEDTDLLKRKAKKLNKEV